MSQYWHRPVIMMIVCGFACLTGLAVGQDSAQDRIRQLGSPEYTEREAAQDALLGFGPEILDSLFAALQTTDPEVSWRVAQLLEEISIRTNDPEVVQRVIEQLTNVKGPLRREMAMTGQRLRSQLSALRSDRALKQIERHSGIIIVSGHDVMLGNAHPIVAPPIQVWFGGDVPKVVGAPELPELQLPPNPGLEAPDIDGLNDPVFPEDGQPFLPAAGQLEAVAEPASPAQQEADEAIRQFVLGGREESAAIDEQLTPQGQPQEEAAQKHAAVAKPFEPIRPLVDPALEMQLNRLEEANPIGNPQPVNPNAPNLIMPADGGNIVVDFLVMPMQPGGFAGPALVANPGGWIESPITQRTIVLNEKWTGLMSDFGLLRDVQGLVRLQLNGLPLGTERLQVIAGIPMLQVLDLNRCTVEFAALMELKHSRPELTILTPATARMGVYGGGGPNGEPGCWIESVIAGAPAAEAGVLAGDRLLKIDGHPVRDFSDLSLYVSLSSPGDVVEVELDRDGTSLTASIELERREQ